MFCQQLNSLPPPLTHRENIVGDINRTYISPYELNNKVVFSFFIFFLLSRGINWEIFGVFLRHEDDDIEKRRHEQHPFRIGKRESVPFSLGSRNHAGYI